MLAETCKRTFTKRRVIRQKISSAIANYKELFRFISLCLEDFNTIQKFDFNDERQRTMFDTVKSIYCQYQYLTLNFKLIETLKLSKTYNTAISLIKTRMKNLFGHDNA